MDDCKLHALQESNLTAWLPRRAPICYTSHFTNLVNEGLVNLTPHSRFTVQHSSHKNAIHSITFVHKRQRMTLMFRRPQRCVQGVGSNRENCGTRVGTKDFTDIAS